jgi:hypothetical protein
MKDEYIHFIQAIPPEIYKHKKQDCNGTYDKVLFSRWYSNSGSS